MWCRRREGVRVIDSLLVSRCFGASRVCSGAAKKLSDLYKALLFFNPYIYIGLPFVLIKA
jgi:hypothetical protein